MKAQTETSGCASNLLAHEDLGHLRKPIVGIYKPSSIVGVDGVPREHLWGRSPFRCPVRGAEGARRADRGEHTGGLPRFGPRWTRKTLLLLGCIELGSSGAWRASYTERMAVWIPNVRTRE